MQVHTVGNNGESIRAVLTLSESDITSLLTILLTTTACPSIFIANTERLLADRIVKLLTGV